VIGLDTSISNTDFHNALEALSSAKSVEELVSRAKSIAAIRYGSYHHIPAMGSHDYERLGHYWSVGLSEDVKAYFDSTGSSSDPIMKTVLSDARPSWLSSMKQHKNLSDGPSQNLINLAIEKIGDGVLAPLYGPFNRRGYAFIGFGKPREFFEDAFLWQLHAVLQATHIRYCVLLETLKSQINLTKREAEVVELIAFGKTNPEIALILGIAKTTVAGYVKRVFLKFDASDRVTVALRAQSFSLY
jgi:LuxR family transcriptional regulator/LuxR family quorum-sensing system transcriptional regulator CciR